MFTIQNFIFPDLKICPISEMYYRNNNNCYYDSNHSRFLFNRLGNLSFDTYFNFFPVDIWKENCQLDDLCVLLNGFGSFYLKIYLIENNDSKKLLQENHIILNHEALRIEIIDWDKISQGLIALEISALLEGEINKISLATHTNSAVSPVKLGIVITHFNRKNYVLPSINRVTKYIKENFLSENISLIVVDNSNNITALEAKDAIVIPNRNLGGTGGFTKGLLYLKDNNYTHCLFMDDDASCEVESIFRTYNLLSYTTNHKLAVAGGLLDETKQALTIEHGANFFGFPRLLKNGYNLKNLKKVLLTHKKANKIDYGGWWFFAFKISNELSYSFPYFVKGDDITFSIENDFTIISPVGIACWGLPFGIKSGLFSEYLWVRFLLMQPILYSRYNLKNTLKHIFKLALILGFAGKYETIRAVEMALKDVLKGSKFWIENIDTVDIRQRLSKFNKNEKMIPIDLSEYIFDDFKENNYDKYDKKGKYKELFFRKLYRFLVFQNFLLPSFLLRKNIILQSKDFGVRLPETFGYKTIIHYDNLTKTGYITNHSNWQFWTLIARIFYLILIIILRQSALKKEYSNNLEYMTSEKFWRNILEEDIN